MPKTIADVLVVHEPAGEPLPVVFDSPHSGNRYPKDFGTVVAIEDLRRTEDAFVDRLYGEAPNRGAVLIAALFPRCYIDPNRHVLDLDPDLLDGPWPVPLKPGKKTVQLGSGLVWRTSYPDLVMYDRKLGVAEVRRRIDAYYRPYHDAVTRALDAAHARFGRVFHLDCHSMPSFSSVKSPEGPGKERPDFVLGDADGKSCAPEFTELVRATLAGMGYHVTVNDPYNGAELIRAYSDPAAGRHSLQIEMKRALYMDEQRIEPNAGYGALKDALTRLIDAICDYARRRR